MTHRRPQENLGWAQVDTANLSPVQHHITVLHSTLPPKATMTGISLMALHFTWPLSQQIPKGLHTHIACTPVCFAWYLLSLQREMQNNAFFTVLSKTTKRVFSLLKVLRQKINTHKTLCKKNWKHTLQDKFKQSPDSYCPIL